MKVIELVKELEKVVKLNPKTEVFIGISKEDIERLEKLNIDKEETEFFDINIKIVPEEDVVFILLKMSETKK